MSERKYYDVMIQRLKDLKIRNSLVRRIEPLCNWTKFKGSGVAKMKKFKEILFK
jgi:hypothetical protein